MSTDVFIRAQIAYWGIFEHGYAFLVLKAVLKPENRASLKLFMKKFIAGGNKFSKIVHYFICETG